MKTLYIKKLVLAGIMTLGIILPSFASDQPEDAIQLIMPDGTTKTFLLKDKPSATFADNSLVITAGKQQASILLTGDEKVEVRFVDSSTAIKNVEKGNFVFRIDADGLTVFGLVPGTSVFVYDANGTILSNSVVSDDGYVSIHIEQSGIYIVKTTSTTLKITK